MNVYTDQRTLKSRCGSRRPASLPLEGISGRFRFFYPEQRPEEQEGTFLKEERFLINSIADILSNSAERKKAEVALRDQAETFEAIIENTSDSVLLISPDFKLLRFNKTA